MSYLLSISIGPVQDFIATARRSRDLWFGSWLLSELSKAAAFAICQGAEEHLSRLVFPSVKSISELVPKSELNVVNKILAVVDDPEATGIAIRQAIEERLEQIRIDAYRRIPRNSLFHESKAILQVKDLVELFWAAYPLKDETDYSSSREKAELMLNARKATRNFKSSEQWSSSVPKSSLDGQRESVIDESIFDKLKTGEVSKEQFLRYRLRENERLCGVGLLKRNGNRAGEEGFFSTSHVAASPLLERMMTKDKEAANRAVKNYLERVAELLGEIDKEAFQDVVGHVPQHLSHEIFADYDGHLLFSERLREFFDGDDLESAQAALNTFFKEAFPDDGPPPAPLPYYALLLADGDNMGKVIDNISTIQIADLDSDIEKHRKLSEKLSEFAKNVSHIVNQKHNGSLVYAGGDDVLAFLPLHTVLQCSRELANEFKNTLKDFAFSNGGEDFQPTLSVGVVIAHHMEALQDALTLLRGAERAAKNVEGKDALAITLSKRSGVDRTIKGSWKDGSQSPFDHRLMHFARLHLAGEIPDGAAYELLDLHLRLNCDKRGQQQVHERLQEAMRTEAVRILGRKKGSEVLEELKNDIASKKTSVEDLAQELIVARIFADAFRQAEGKALA